jgi:protein phosphatase
MEVSTLTMRPAVLSEPGPREKNEDAAFASPRLLAVADGVGGAATGEVASRLAIDKLVALDNRRLDDTLEELLRSAWVDANEAIAFVVSYDPRHQGMATTLTAVALSNEGRYLVANVGDSRAYLLRDGCLRRLTRDDSLVQELIDRGRLSEDDARHHPQRSIVLDALNGDDRLLLCSDGVTDYLTDAEVAEMLRLCGDAAAAVRQVVGAALRHGSRDNVTAVVSDVQADPDAHGGWLNMPAFDALEG